MTEKKKPIKNKRRNKKTSPFRGQRIVASILIFIVVIALVAVGTFSVYARGQIKDAPELYAEDFIQPESSKIFDRDGNEIYDTGLKIRENISYDDLPQSLIDAFVAVEDSRFFEHNGFDVPRFTKAALENLLSSLRQGRVSFGQGGSTFTMQLIKNTHFMSEDVSTGEVVLPEGGVSGIDRKVQEIYLSRKMEKEQLLSKKLIFELYLNMINFGSGNNILGVQNSAEAYFDKDVSELNLLESAFLAGVINAPSKNTPYHSIENATKRTHTVLDLMKLHGYITQDELDLAKSVKLENMFVGRNAVTGEALPYQAYIDVVIDEVVELTGNNPTVVPMKIYTAMDSNIQDGIDTFQRREIPSLNQGADQGNATHPHLQVGSAILDNASSEIIGIVGGYDYNGRLIHNRASSRSVQPASVIKPVVDYALAFEYLGYSTSHVLVDEPWQYAGTDITVGNYDGRYLGEITLMHAVADSRNIPALKTMQAAIDTLGNSGVVEYLNTIGFSKVSNENFGISFAIGGGDFDTSPIEIAGAYTMLMNEGNFTDPHTVTRIEFQDGRDPLVPQLANAPVISDAAAYLTSRTMKYAVEGPYPGFLRSIRKPYTVFGKTGTNGWDRNRPSFIPEDSQKARLMMASTDQFTMATWAGFDRNNEEFQPWFTQAQADFNLPGKLNSYLLDLLNENYGAGEDIARPDSVVDIQHITGTFPYQSPLSGMNSNLISNGLIKKEFANLTSAKGQPLSALKSQSVNIKQSGNTLNIDVDMSPYPDPSRLNVASSTLTMKFPGSNKTTTGTRLYDDSWVFGAVRYKTEVRVDGNPVKEVLGANNKQSLTYQLSGGEGKIEVCSYYTYNLSTSQKSNVECTPVNASNIGQDNSSGNSDPSGPSSKKYEDVIAWANSNGVTVTEDWDETDKLDRHMTIKETKPNIFKGKIDIEKIKKSGLEIEVYEFVEQIQKDDDYSVYKNTIEGLKAYMTVNIAGEGDGDIIKEFKVDGNEAYEINLRRDAGKTLSILLGPDSD